MGILVVRRLDRIGHGVQEIMPPKKDESWHLGKEIPISTIAAILIQTVGLILWQATKNTELQTKLDNLSYQVAAISAEKYTTNDARKDLALMQEQINEVKRRLERMENGR